MSASSALARAQAASDKLEDGTFAGRLPACPGVIAFASTLPTCEEEWRSTLEDWIVVGLKMGHLLPVLDHLYLHEGPGAESLEPG